MDSNNIIKLIALSIVGGVAKALFAPRVYSPSPVVRETANKVVDAGLKAVEKNS